MMTAMEEEGSQASLMETIYGSPRHPTKHYRVVMFTAQGVRRDLGWTRGYVFQIPTSEVVDLVIMAIPKD